jgi:hypothetical protein
MAGLMETTEDILNRVAAAAGTSISELVGNGRNRNLSRARAIAVHLLRTESKLNGAEVARIFGRTRQWASLVSTAATEALVEHTELPAPWSTALAQRERMERHKASRAAQGRVGKPPRAGTSACSERSIDFVVSGLEWPSTSCTSLRLAPPLSSVDAFRWRKWCGVACTPTMRP